MGGRVESHESGLTMFKFVLAFLVWLFATGKYSDWLALLVAPATPSPTPAPASTSAPKSGAASGGGSAGSSDILGALGSLGGVMSSGSENPGASSSSTPDDLISGFTGGTGL